MGDRVRASLQGYWGFEKYNAPSFELVNVHNQILGSWRLRMRVR